MTADRRKSAWRPGVALLLLLGVLPEVDPGLWAQRPGQTSRASGYTPVLWMKNGPKVDASLFKALHELGIAGTNVAGTASSSNHASKKIPFYVDHAAGKGWLTLREDAWQNSRRKFLAERDPRWLIRPECLTDPEVRARIQTRLEEVVRQAKDNRPFAYSLDDEISLSGHGSPFDFCHHPSGILEFQQHLEHSYGNIEALRESWGTDTTKFSKAHPFTTDQIRRREFIKPGQKWNFAPWWDFRKFMSTVLIGEIEHFGSEVRLLDPGAAVGFTGGSAPTPFSGLDWAQVLQHVTFVEPYDVGGTRELVRSFAKPGTLIFRTLFRDEIDSRFNQHELWDYALRGDRGVIIWSAEHVFARSDSSLPTVWSKALAPTLKNLQKPAVTEFLSARRADPDVAILESEPSNAMHWMLDTRFMGPSWPSRLASAEITDSSQNRTREAWQKLLEDLHFDYEHITPGMIERGKLSRYKVLILPRALALSEKQVEEIRRFLDRGTVIADCQLALYDEKLRYMDVPPLDDIFGIHRGNRTVNLRGIRYVGPIDPDHPHLRVAESGIRGAPRTPYMIKVAGSPVMFVKSQKGGGRAVYLNLLLTEYLKERTRAVRGEHQLCEEIRGLLRAAGARAIAEIRFPQGGSVPVRLHRRVIDGRTYLGVIANWRTSTVPFRDAALLRLKAPKIEILLHGAHMVTNMFDGKPPQRRSVIRNDDPLPLFAGRIYRLD